MSTEKKIDLDTLYPEPYCVENNSLSYKNFVKNSPEPVVTPLCNFSPFIVSQVIHDDGAETNTKVKVSGISSSGKKLPTVEVSSDEFANLNWVTKQWGFGCNIAVGSTVKDKIRFALQSTADDAECIIVFSVTGWKIIDGKHYFLMPDDDEHTVTLPNKMNGYTMRREYTEADIAQCYSFLEECLAPREIIYPLLAFVFMSPLNTFMREAGCEPKTVLMLVGKTGSKKSTLAALMLSFFGNFTASSLPLSFKDTPLSILHHSFSLKDVLTCIDDFHPSGKQDEFNMTNTAQTIMRAYGDRVGRGKLSSKSEAMESRFPQGNAIITAEFPPDIGESGTARYFTVEMTPNSLNNSFLTMYQEEAAKGTLNSCMFAYTEWLKKEYLDDDKLKEKMIQTMHETFVSSRDAMAKKLAENGVMCHPRIPEVVAVMTIGFTFFLQFIFSHGLITEEKQVELLIDFEDVMFNLATKQSNSIEQDKPVFKFICKLNSLLESGRCYVLNRACTSAEKGPTCLGYEDDERYYLFKSQTHQAVKKLCDDQGEAFSISETSLAKALIAEHLVEPGDKQITKVVRLDDKTTLRLLVIPKEKMKEVVERYS